MIKLQQPTYPPRYCEDCGKGVAVTRNGTYRRHFTRSQSGRLHVCLASGRNALTAAELGRPKPKRA